VNSGGRRWLLSAAVALAGVAALAALAWTFKVTWADSGVSLGLHGWIALTVALVGVTVVGGGLMWLAFYSSRSGWDDIDREV
jgi:hypothetical protein